MNSREEKLQAFGRLLDIMDELRTSCPWDRKQTMESIRHLSIEEVYELGDAILDKNIPEIKKELGDLLLHIVFYSKIASETEDFDIADVTNALCDKLIFRHPHVYGDANAKDEDEVKRNWEAQKMKEGRKSVLEGVPKSLPAMVKASRIQDKARGVGFDWDNKEDVWNKVEEEKNELKEAIENKSFNEIEEEFGDLMFSMINYARFIGVNPEDALERTNKKFISRFTYLEENSKKDGKVLDQMSLEEMDKYWNEAKMKSK